MTEHVLCRLTRVDEPRCPSPAVVRVEDPSGGSEPGCRPHAARALGGIKDAQVHPLPGHDRADIAVYADAAEASLNRLRSHLRED